MQWAREYRPRSAGYRECAIVQLAKEFGNRNLADITAQDVVRHQKRRQAAGVKAATINRERSVLNHMFSMAVKWGLVDENQVKSVEAFREDNIKPRPITEEEEQQLLAVLP